MDADNKLSAEEVLTGISYQLEAIIRLLEEKGLMTRQEVLNKIRELMLEGQRPS